MSIEHARLGPSSADRWVNCPGSVEFIERLRRTGRIKPDTSSAAAEEGTRAHDYLSQALLKGVSVAEVAPDEDPEFIDYIETSRIRILEYLEEHQIDKWWSEITLPMLGPTFPIPEAGGTADVLGWSSTRNHIVVLDFKFGKGIWVKPDATYQLALYAMAAVDTLERMIGRKTNLFTAIDLVIVQPRHHSAPLLQSYTMTYPELERLHAHIAARAHQALDEQPGPYHPSEKACQWCPASPFCKAQADHAVEVATREFPAYPGEDLQPADLKSYNFLSGEDYAWLLAQSGLIRKWVNGLADAALEYRLNGGEIPDWKVSRRRKNRVFVKGTDATVLSRALGVPAEELTETKLKALTKIETLAKAHEKTEALSKFITKPEGDLVLVPKDAPGEEVDVDQLKPEPIDADEAAALFTRE